MKVKRSIAGWIGMLCLLAGSVQAADWYVATNGNDSADGTNWSTAKLTIQAGVDAAASNDTVWVSNGVYATGSGRAGAGTWLNRVAIDKPVIVESENGPDETFIVGGGMRCVYVTNGAVLSGFTLTNGTTESGSIFEEPATPDYNGGGVLCEDNGIVTNCLLTSNWACYAGGGVSGGQLNNCLIVGNTSDMRGGGSHESIVSDCVLSNNIASNYGGGGASKGTLNNCLLTDNTGGAVGGGAFESTLNQCRIENNHAGHNGGGVGHGVLHDCLLVGNWVPSDGGGAYMSKLNNCTVVSNYTVDPLSGWGGGTYSCEVNNSIVADNNAASFGHNWWVGTFTNSCTYPMPSGTGNIIIDPQFVDASAADYRLLSNSPCINAGDNALVSGTMDLDGNPRIRNHVVDMGAFEFEQPATWYVATNGNDSADGAAWLSAKLTIQAAIDAALNGDTVWVSNGVYATGGRIVWSESGLPSSSNRVVIDKGLTVQSINGPQVSIIQGAKDPTTANGLGDAAVRCAFVESNAVLSGFTLTNGATATNGSHAFTFCGGGVVGSGILSNCIVTGNSAQSSGGGSYYELTLNNCTLTGNSALNGGGASLSTLNNCWVGSNSAQNSGGGTSHCTLNNCMVVGNIAHAFYGGGAYGRTLNNCTIVGNEANIGGGVASCVVNNSIVYFNTAPTDPNFWGYSFNHSCTVPNLGGTGNITNDPQFVDAAAGNYRLQTNSPCVDQGSNAAVVGTNDLAGNPRIVFGVVDMGAFEVQSLAGYSDWASSITNGLTNATDCAAGDGVPNLLKYATGCTHPMEPDEQALISWILNGGIPTLQFNLDPNATDISLWVQGSDEMVDDAVWRGLATNLNGSWGGATNVSESATGEPVVVTVEDTLPLLTNRFLRLKVTRP